MHFTVYSDDIAVSVKENGTVIRLFVYGKQKSCNDIQLQNNSRFSNDDKRIEIMVHDFGIIKKLMWAVATASIGSLVVAFFELIIK
jgi:hypothetical protein